jgi:hypothetical protein
VVQMREAMQLRRAWNAKVSPPCDHPEVDREYNLGSHTGDYDCLTCGESFSPGEWDEIRFKGGKG